MTIDRRPPLRPVPALATAVAVLATANVARSLVVPSRWHLTLNLATGAAVVVVGVAGGLGRAGLGLRRDRWAAGARLGGLAAAAITGVVLAGVLLGVVADDAAHVDRGELLLKALVLIPVGTVLVEELAFRGVVDGLLRATDLPPARALVAGAVLFGLWHVVPAYRGGSSGLGGLDAPLQALVTFGATTVAGVGFSWLRTRSDSLVAPMLAHLATNSATLVLVWWLG